jgi:hypothetical protein
MDQHTAGLPPNHPRRITWRDQQQPPAQPNTPQQAGHGCVPHAHNTSSRPAKSRVWACTRIKALTNQHCMSTAARYWARAQAPPFKLPGAPARQPMRCMRPSSQLPCFDVSTLVHTQWGAQEQQQPWGEHTPARAAPCCHTPWRCPPVHSSTRCLRHPHHCGRRLLIPARTQLHQQSYRWTQIGAPNQTCCHTKRKRETRQSHEARQSSQGRSWAASSRVRRLV